MEDRNIKNYSCEDAVSVIDEYLDGETDMETSELLEAHLAECPDCRRELERRRSLREAIISAFPTEEPPADLHDKIMARIRLDAAARRLRIIRRVTSVAAVLAVAVGIGVAALSLRGLPAADKAIEPEMAGDAALNDGNAYFNEAPSEADLAGNVLEFPGGDAENEASPDASNDDIFAVRFAEYGRGFDGAYMIYAVDADGIGGLADAFGAEFDGVAFTIPYSPEAESKLTATLGIDAVRFGEETGIRCIIVFVK